MWGHSDNAVTVTSVEVPLSAFQQTSDLEWALDDKLAPIDTQSVLATIEHIKTKLRTPVPSFDLNIKYIDVRIFEGKSRDLVKVRYRPEPGKKSDSNVQSSKTSPAGLKCAYNRQESRQFHRRTWICAQYAPFISRPQPPDGARLRKLQEDYERVFPENGKSIGGPWN